MKTFKATAAFTFTSFCLGIPDEMSGDLKGPYRAVAREDGDALLIVLMPKTGEGRGGINPSYRPSEDRVLGGLVRSFTFTPKGMRLDGNVPHFGKVRCCGSLDNLGVLSLRVPYAAMSPPIARGKAGGRAKAEEAAPAVEPFQLGNVPLGRLVQELNARAEATEGLTFEVKDEGRRIRVLVLQEYE